MTAVDTPTLVNAKMLTAALHSVVDALGHDVTNMDRHNTGQWGCLSDCLARELGVDAREVFAAESVVDDLCASITDGAPLHFNERARHMLIEMDDMAELGWEWGVIADQFDLFDPELP